MFVGVDLAWGQRNRTGLAVLDETGTLLDLTSVTDDEEILDTLRRWAPGRAVVAFDAPIVVTNPTGRRACESELARVFARHHAGPHPTNTGRAEFADGTRAGRLSDVLGLDVDPHSDSPRRALEVYPHAAVVALFGLSRTLRYKHKPGRDLPLLRSELLRLVALVESLDDHDPPARVRDHPGWQRLRATVEGATRKVDLRRVEDVVDAAVCAYVALHAVRRPERTHVFGDARRGAIVTPMKDARLDDAE